MTQGLALPCSPFESTTLTTKFTTGFFFPTILTQSVSAAASFECKALRSCRVNFYFTAKQRDSETMVLCSQTVVGTNAPDTFEACWDLF